MTAQGIEPSLRVQKGAHLDSGMFTQVWESSRGINTFGAGRRRWTASSAAPISTKTTQTVVLLNVHGLA